MTDPRAVHAAITARDSIAELQLAVMMSGMLTGMVWAALRALGLARRLILRH